MLFIFQCNIDILVTGFVIGTVNIFLSSNNFRVEKVESLVMLFCWLVLILLKECVFISSVITMYEVTLIIK